MGIHLDSQTIPVIAAAAAQVLGPDHPLVTAIEALRHDGSDAHLVYAGIEALPEEQRKALAGIAAEWLMPGLNSPSAHRH